MDYIKKCNRCMIDDTVPGVSFNENGICSYCTIYETMEKDWPLGSAGEIKLEKIITKIKEQGKGKIYDCIVGISGGTDSTYSLLLAKKLGLRPLAVHFDNGWCSEIAVHNIKKAVTKLDVDLQTYVVDWEEFKDLLVSFQKSSLPWADAPTDYGIIGALYQIASEENLKYIITGTNFRSEGSMPFEWTYTDARTIKYIQKKYGRKPLKTFPNPTLWKLVYYKYIKGIETITLLNSMPYSKTEARKILRDELGWEYYDGHHYESVYTRFVYSFWLPQKFGIDKRIISLSALVRNQEITRENALQILQEPIRPGDEIEEDVDYVIKKLGLTHEEFSIIMRNPPKSMHDYPSYPPLVKKVYSILSPLLHLLSWNPPLFRYIEARKGNNIAGN